MLNHSLRRGACLLLAAIVLVSSAPSWKIIEANFATIAVDIAFTNPNDGLSAVFNNGYGNQALYTNDGGAKWIVDPSAQALLFAGVALQGTAGIIVDQLGAQYSTSDNVTNGYDFVASHVPGGIKSQNCDDFGDGKTFGIVGQDLLGGGEGVAVSTNQGKSFTFMNISIARTWARYGAFPSATNWFVTLGEWPGENAVENAPEGCEVVRTISERLRIVRNKITGEMYHDLRKLPTPADCFNCYAGQIVATTDGGKTWTQQWYNQTYYYFNQITCGTTQNCVAVAEAQSGKNPGVHIFTTKNGGKTWKETLFTAAQDYSIFAAEFVSATEVWCSGASLSLPLEGYFWHSTDGGNTWTFLNNALKGAYPVAISFSDPNHGWAVGPNSLGSSFLGAFS